MAFLIKDKNIMINTSGDILGQSLALNLAEHGANIIILDPDSDRGERISDQINSLGQVSEDRGRAKSFLTPKANEENIRETINLASEVFGGIDTFINCPKHHKATFLSDTDFIDNINQSIDENLKYSIYFAKNLKSYLDNKRHSRIIFFIPFYSHPVLSISYGAIEKFIESYASENSSKSLRMNGLRTPFSEGHLLSHGKDGETINTILSEIKKTRPSSKIVNNEDLCNIVLFLASPLSQGLNGQVLSMI